MALFNRNKNKAPDMPPELDEYYQSERKSRSGMAWLLGLGTLLVTVFVVLGLFFGGRFLYRKFRSTNKPAPVAVETQKPASEESPKSDTPTSSDQPASRDNNSQPSQSGTTTTPSGGSSTSGTVTAPGIGTTTTPSPSQVQGKGEDLPSAGPEDTFAIFFAVSVLGYLIHRKLSSQN